MNAHIFNKALQATARVACCAGLVSIVGCETKSSDTEKDTAQTDSEGPEIVVPEDPTFDQCLEAISAGFAATDFDTSELLECCLLATDEVGYDSLHNDPQYADLKENCCAQIAAQNEFSPACTPWGPPTPPTMPPSKLA